MDRKRSLAFACTGLAILFVAAVYGFGSSSYRKSAKEHVNRMNKDMSEKMQNYKKKAKKYNKDYIKKSKWGKMGRS